MQSAIIRQRPQVSQFDLCSTFCSLYIAARGLSTSRNHHATGGSNNATPNPVSSSPPGTTKRAKQNVQLDTTKLAANTKQAALNANLAERAAATKLRADEVLAQQQEKMKRGPVQGGLAKGNIFGDTQIGGKKISYEEDGGIVRGDQDLVKRSPNNMAPRLDPNPNARARWTRMMVIRNIRRRGRLTKVMHIARSERSHVSRSRFFKTSIKKLAPLARQIAGKTLDEAILQMRFSTKKAAQEVRKHLIQARNEAIVEAGMGLPDSKALSKTKVQIPDVPRASIRTLIEQATKGDVASSENVKEVKVSGATQSSGASPSYEIVDPSNTRALPMQLHSKTLKRGLEPNPTDMYIAEAWVNRGSYENEASPRARGRTDILRHPNTSISVVLKEEKTRSREKQEKEIKAIRKRLNGKLWTQMPDRPLIRQSQYVLW